MGNILSVTNGNDVRIIATPRLQNRLQKSALQTIEPPNAKKKRLRSSALIRVLFALKTDSPRNLGFEANLV
jgi:hypothetical protein